MSTFIISPLLVNNKTTILINALRENLIHDGQPGKTIMSDGSVQMGVPNDVFDSLLKPMIAHQRLIDANNLFVSNVQFIVDELNKQSAEKEQQMMYTFPCSVLGGIVNVKTANGELFCYVEFPATGRKVMAHISDECSATGGYSSMDQTIVQETARLMMAEEECARTGVESPADYASAKLWNYVQRKLMF